MFNYGRRHYSETVRRVDANDLTNFWNMFKNKYWGATDSVTWEANNEASNGDEGEITATYTTADGKEIILMRVCKGNFTLFVTKQDIDDGFVTNFIERHDREMDAMQSFTRRLRDNQVSSLFA